MLQDGVPLRSIGEKLEFTFHQPLRLLSVTPPTGPEGGGTRLRIHGKGFVPTPSMACRFDAESSASIPAIFISSTEIVCVTVPHAPGRVSVSVSNNGVDFGESLSDTSFVYHAHVRVETCSPDSGSVNGGTAVSLRGVGFSFSPLLSCQFSEASVVNATYVSDSEVRCTSPPRRGTGVVRVVVRPC